MAIEKTYLLGKNITLGCGFDLQAKAPLDSRQVVPEYDGLQALIDGNAAYEGMIVYDEGTKKTYQAQLVDGVLAFREFGINEAELKALIASETTAAMEFKGVATALPENPSKGDFYKVTASFKVGEDDAKIGDSIVYDGAQWFIIPSGDDIEDTWRPVTDVDNDSTLTFAAGDKLDVAVAADGTITYKHEAIDAPTATPVGEDEQTRTYIASIETDGHGHITGYKTATENVEDTNTEYTFEGQSDEATSVYFQVTSNEEGATAEVVYLDAYSKNEADAAFKVTHKELGENDTDEVQINVGDDNKISATLVDGKIAKGKLDADVQASLEKADKSISEIGYDNEAYEYGNTEAISIKIDGGLYEDDPRKIKLSVGVLPESITATEIKDGTITTTELAESIKISLGLADSAVQEGDIADLRSASHTHTFVETELNKIADGDVAKWNAAEQNAKDYADDQIEALELGTMSKETADDYVKKSDATGYGDILTKTEAKGAYQPKGEYASAAQGAKADTSVQSISTTYGLEGQNVRIEFLGQPAGTMNATPDSFGIIGIMASVDEKGIEGKHIADNAITAAHLSTEFAESLAAAEHEHVVADITDFDAKVKEYGYATTGEVATAKGEAEAKAAELDAALKSELQGEIETAKTEAANQDAVVLAEAQKHTDALANGAVATNAGNIETLFEMFQWGSF